MIQPRWPTPSWTLKWVGLLLALSIVGLFALISTARAITWTGANLECQLDLSCGELTYAWRPESWRLEGERYPGMPGWSVATYGGQTRYSLWITRGAISSWEFVSVPLWIPVRARGRANGLLWYRQRAKTKALIDRCQARIAPRKRKKMLGLLLVLACCIIHVILAFLCILTMIFFLDSFVQPTVTVCRAECSRDSLFGACSDCWVHRRMSDSRHACMEHSLGVVVCAMDEPPAPSISFGHMPRLWLQPHRPSRAEVPRVWGPVRASR